jgi:WD40 repeat protein
MKCARCGSEISFDQPECEACGAELPELLPAFQRALDQYRAHRKRFREGSLTQAGFTAELKKLQFKHDGRYWTIGAKSASWFRQEGKSWFPADPPVAVRRVAAEPHTPSSKQTVRPAARAPGPSPAARKMSAEVAPEPSIKVASRNTAKVASKTPSSVAQRAPAKRGSATEPAAAVWVSPPVHHRIKGLTFADRTTLVATCFDPDAPVLHIGSSASNALRVSEGTFLLDAIDVSADGRTLFCAGVGQRTSGIWSWKSDAIGFGPSIPPARRIIEVPTVIRSLAASRDGSRLVAGSIDGRVMLIDATAGRELRSFEACSNSVGRTAVTPDGRYAATAGMLETRVKLWEASSCRQLELTHPSDGVADSIAFSPDGRQLLAVVRGSVIIWDVPSGDRGAQVAPGKSKVESATFSIDGSRLITAGREDKQSATTLSLWDAVTGQLVRNIGRIDATVEHIAVSPDGSLIACAGSDLQVYVWA